MRLRRLLQGLHVAGMDDVPDVLIMAGTAYVSRHRTMLDGAGNGSPQGGVELLRARAIPEFLDVFRADTASGHYDDSAVCVAYQSRQLPLAFQGGSCAA